jgi:kynurenine formamidase
MVGQYGTHVDPPAHFAEDGITMDRIPLKQMILPLVVFDATPLLVKDPNHAFSLDDLRAWEKKHGRVPKGAFARCAPICTRIGTAIRSGSSALPFRPGRSRPSSSWSSNAA